MQLEEKKSKKTSLTRQGQALDKGVYCICEGDQLASNRQGACAQSSTLHTGNNTVRGLGRQWRNTDWRVCHGVVGVREGGDCFYYKPGATPG